MPERRLDHSVTGCCSHRRTGSPLRVDPERLISEAVEGHLIDAENDSTGMHLRTLAHRLRIQEKDFAAITAKAGARRPVPGRVIAHPCTADSQSRNHTSLSIG